MSYSASGRSGNPLTALRRLARPASAGPEAEFCELCSAVLSPVHRHLLEIAERRIVCACDACALRFQLVIDGRFRLVPRDVWSLPGFRLSDSAWEDLALPIHLAFFFHNAALGRIVAFYPSPAGATESRIPLAGWETLVQDNPALARMEPDVQALLVNRVGGKRLHFLAPIDRCYQLVGLIRMHWRGLSGGQDVWEKIDSFFDELAAEARPLPKEAPHCHA